MDMPRHVTDAAERAAHKYPDDAQEAIDAAVKEIQVMPDFKQFLNALVRDAVGMLVYAARTKRNNEIKNQTGEYRDRERTPVHVGNSESVQRIMNQYYDYAIAGTSIGMLFGRELPGLAEVEDNQAESHRFNARLLRRLQQLVPENKRVQEAITNKKLGMVFEEVRKENSR